jgi:hypothetical protein
MPMLPDRLADRVFLDHGNLLYLLQEHAGIEPKIEVPEDWVSPPSRNRRV